MSSGDYVIKFKEIREIAKSHEMQVVDGVLANR